jgi:hypothetical protein
MAFVRSRTAVAALLVGAAALACGGSTQPRSGAPTKLSFTVQPSSATAGTGIASAVAIQDASGNTVTTATNAVTVGLGANPPGATFSGTTTVVAVSGVATFSNLSIDACGAGYTLAATASGLTGATSTAFNVTGDCWSTKASMPTARVGLGVGVVNAVLYAVGGIGGGGSTFFGTVEAYDPTNSWTTKVSMPTPRALFAVGVVNGVLYAVGGYNNSAGNVIPLGTVEAYDPSTNSWTTKGSMPTPRYSLAVGVVNGILYAVGGIGGGNTLLGTVEAYDPSTNTWTTKASMATPRANFAVGVVIGVLYAVGGTSTAVLGTVETYDPPTNTWTTKASMPTARHSLGVGAVNGVLYAVGGYAGGNTAPLSTVEAYDPLTNSWMTKASMLAGRYSLGVGVVNGVLYAVGGYAGGLSGTVEAYQP